MNSGTCLTDNPSSEGFLSGFVEASVELPSDGLNGDCTVHYSCQHSNYELIVKLLKGLKEGMGTIMKDGAPFIQIEYHHGIANGSVCRMSDNGVIEMRGQLMNGVEHRLFLEYGDGKKVVWRGYYRNGMRYSEVKKSDKLDGCYDERSVTTGYLLSIAQYNKKLGDKNGRCFEFENGSLRSECVYDNGVKKHIVREFVNGKMVVFDLTGKKVYEGVYYGDMKSGFLCHERMEGMAGFFKEVDSRNQLIAVSQYDELNLHKNGKCFEMEDGKVKRMCLYEMNQLVRVMIEFSGSTMIQYNGKEKRVYEGGFRGDMKNGFMRDGRGYEMDENERMKRVCVYENGRMKRVMREFNGSNMIEYDSNGRKMYEGQYGGDIKNGFKRNGQGYSLDMNGIVKQCCIYEDGCLVRVIQELNGNEMTEYDENGKRRYVGGFTGDMKTGFKRNGRGYCSDENEVVELFGLFDNGVVKRVVQKFDGLIMTEYHDNGMMRYMGEWKGDMENGFLREGKGREYETDGRKAIYSGEWSNGLRDGNGEEMDENGMSAIGYWKDGKKAGFFHEMDENGRVKRVCVYENGRMKQVTMEFDEEWMIEYNVNGEKVYEGEYKGDVKSGFVRNGYGYCLSVNGKDKQYCVYENGQFIRVIQELNENKMTEYDENGKRRYVGEFTGDMKTGFKRNGRGYCFDENEVVKRYSTFENGVMKRVIQAFYGVIMGEYYENGMMRYSGEFKGDMENGFVRNGYGYCLNMNEKDMELCLYEDGYLVRVLMELNDSTMTEYDSNGKKRYIGGFSRDMARFKRNGRGYCLDENEVVKLYCVFENGVTKRVIQSFVGVTMTEYHENGMMSYIGEFTGDMKNGYVREGKGREFGADGRIVVYVGEWKNGKREGFGTELRNWYISYRGEWSNGLRDGSGEELDENGMSSIGRWKDGKKNGLFYERDVNIVIKRGFLFENGEMKRVIQEWELCHMILSRRIDFRSQFLGGLNAFFVSNIKTGHIVGLFQLNRIYFAVDWFKGILQGVMVDMESKTMSVLSKHGKWLTVERTNELIDLDVNGRRWEGAVKNGIPFGYGTLFDEEGRKEYEGFMIHERRACYGIEYYSDIGRVKYMGFYCNNKRCGYGVFYHRNGVINYDGMWKDDYPYSLQFDGKTLHNHTESIVIPNNSFNQAKSFILHSFFHLLKRIVIGDGCYGSVRLLELDGLGELESIEIGMESFTIGKDWNTIKTSKRTDGTCRIVNCPKLNSIQIDYHSFTDYRSFELSNLPSLQSIDIDGYCFYHAPSFSLTGLIDWLV